MSASEITVLSRDATAFLVQLVAEAQRDDPFAPVTVVAPTSRAAIHVRRAVAARSETGAIANVTFAVARRFAEELVGPVRLLPRRRLTRTALDGACRVELDERRGPVGLPRSVTMVAEVADRYEELRDNWPHSVDVLARRGGRSGELAEVVRAVRRRIAADHFDDVDLLEVATALVNQGAIDVGPVIVFAPDRITPSARRLYDAIGELAEVRLVALGTSKEPPFTSALEAPDERVAAREAVRLVRRALRHPTPRPERIGLFYPRRHPYLALLGSELDAAAIAWSGPSPGSLIDHPSARLVLALASVAPERVDRRQLVALVGAATSGSTAGASIGAWDRVTRRTGLAAASAHEWAQRMRAGPPRDGQPWFGRDRTAARELAAIVAALASNLERLRAARTWTTAVDALSAALDEFRRPAEHRLAGDGAAGESERLVLAVLDEVAALDAVEPYGGVGALAAVLESSLDRDPPQTGRLGHGVVVGPLEHAVGLELDLAIVVGCSEGELPARVPASPLISIADRDAAGLEEWSSTATVARDLHRLTVALSAATERVAVFARTDSGSGRQRFRSRFVAAGTPVRRPLRIAALTTADALSPSELAVAVAMRADVGSVTKRLPRAASSRRAGRVQAPFGPYDGDVGATDAPLDVVAPTSIETYATCPFQYFVDHVLRVERVAEPELRHSLDPSDRGVLVHAVLERYVRRVIAADLPPDETSRAAVLAEIADEEFAACVASGRAGKRALFDVERRRILDALQRERVEDEHRRAATGATPVLVEHRFGADEGDRPTVVVGGRRVGFRGTIDRVDRLPSGTLEVVDYKSGRADRYRGDDPVGHGRLLQLPVYGLAAQARFGDVEVRSTYRFVGDEPVEVEFVLDEPAARRFRETVSTLVSSIDAGCFPYRPGRDDEHCRSCAHDAICPADRSSRWSAARADERLSRYVELVEGDVEEEGS